MKIHNTSVSSRIQKGHGATDHWGHLIMPAGHPVDSLGNFKHPPSPIKGTNKIGKVGLRYRQLLPLCTQAVIRYCVIGVNAIGVFSTVTMPGWIKYDVTIVQ